MSVRSACGLLLILLLAPAAEAGWFGGGSKKKLPKPAKLVQIRPHDAARFTRPAHLASRYSPTWGGLGETFYKPQRAALRPELDY